MVARGPKSPRRGPADAPPDPEAAGDPESISRELDALRRYAEQWVRVAVLRRAARARRSLDRMVVKACFALAGIVLLATACVLFLVGLSDLAARATGGGFFTGALVVGGGVLLSTAVAAPFVLHRRSVQRARALQRRLEAHAPPSPGAAS